MGFQTWKQKTLALAKEFGVTVTINAEGQDIELMAPSGFVMAASTCHTAVTADWDAVTPAARSAVWQGVYEDLSAGLDKCDDGHSAGLQCSDGLCGWCRPAKCADVECPCCGEPEDDTPGFLAVMRSAVTVLR